MRQKLDAGKITENYTIFLSKEVRKEFYVIWALSEFLCTDLTERAAHKMYASNSSLEGYAFVETEVEPQDGWVHDAGLVQTAHVARLMERKKCRLKRHRWFRYRLKSVLNGEICAFRRSALEAAQQNRNKEIVIFTDNSNVYYSIQKGRSKCRMLHILCRNFLFL